MERRKLKAVMILILLLLNAFLLSYLLWQFRMERLFRQEMRERLTALFALDGVTLSPGAFARDTPPEALLLASDETLQKNVASFFLGEGCTVEEEPALRRYRSGDAYAEFFPNGDFTVSALAVPAEDLLRDFCRAWSYQPMADAQTLTAAAYYGEIPVFNCRVSFSRAPDGTLWEASGTLLSRNAFPVTPDLSPLDAIGALEVFQSARRKNRLSASAVSAVSPCYALEQLDSGETELVPAWRVETDRLDYYINALTGALTAA